MHPVELLNNIVAGNHLLAYFLIFLVTIVEGEVIAIAAGILVLAAALNFWICLFVILVGGVIKTLLGYSIGELLHKKYNNSAFLQYVEKKVAFMLPHFQKKPFWSIFWSKFLVGVNHSVIIFSGYKKVNYRTYLKAEFFSTIIWAPLFISIGYFFSYTALRITRSVSRFFLIIILCVIAFFIVDKLITLLVDFIENYKQNNENQN